MNTILTDDERPKLPPAKNYLGDDASWGYGASDMEAYADAREAAVLAKLREQEPVAAQQRFRHPQKTMPDWSIWQSCFVRSRPAWEVDSQGYEVEYRPLYAAPLPAVVQVPQGRAALLASLKSSQSALRKLSFKDDAVTHALERLVVTIKALQEQA